MLKWPAINTVLLDMDGTLLDLFFDQEVWNKRLPERFAEIHQCDPITAKEEVARRLADSRGTLNWYSLDHWTERLGVDLFELELELAHLIKPRAGAIKFLKRLAASELTVILATNAQPDSMRRKLDITGIDRYFDIVGCSHHYGACKEEMSFWHTFTAELGIDPATSLLIDDNLTVLDTARQFGIQEVLGVRRPSSGGAPIVSERFHCIENFDEVLSGCDDD